MAVIASSINTDVVFKNDKQTNGVSSTYETVAIKDSKDVHVGSKNVYNGKVIINHIVCSSAFDTTGYELKSEDSNTIQSGDECSLKYKLLKATSNCQTEGWRRLIWIILVVITLCALILVFGVVLSSAIQNGNKNKIAEYSSDEDLNFVTRAEWQGQKPNKYIRKLDLPVSEVIIAHTAYLGCRNINKCTGLVHQIQNYHMKTRNYSDIAYQFLVGGNGQVFIGRGWDSAGEHTPQHNFISILIAFIGHFDCHVPTNEQLSALDKLIKRGQKLNKISTNYTLYSQCQLTATVSPGQYLHNILISWPQFNKSLECKNW